MKKFYVLLLLALSALSLQGQMTTVSSTGVVDSDGTLWQYGTWAVDFRPNPDRPDPNQYNINGTPLSPSIAHQSGSLGIGGNFSFSIYQSNTITPSGSSWTLKVCPLASSLCGNYIFTAAGTTMDVTAALNATIPAPRFRAIAGAYGYADVEAILTDAQGDTYWNMADGCQRYYNTLTTTWACSPGAGQGAGSIGQTQYKSSSGALMGGPPTNCSNFSSPNLCIAAGGPALLPPGDTTAFQQPVSSTATASCVVDLTAGTVSFFGLNLGSGYIPSNTYTVTIAGLPAGASLGTVTATANSSGVIPVAGYTITGANSGFTTANNNTLCPITTITVQAPPAAAAPVSILNFNEGLTTYGPVFRLDDFGAKGDGTTDDTLAFNDCAEFATIGGTIPGACEATAGKNYYFATVSGQYLMGHDNGFVPIASTFTCTSTGGVPNSPCTLTTAGSGLTTTTVTNTASTGTGATFTPGSISGGTVSTLTIGGSGTGYPASWLVYVGPTCQGVPCAISTPINNYQPYNAQLQNNLTIIGNSATFSGQFTGTSVVAGACVHISSWSVTGTTATFQYTHPNCTISVGQPLSLLGFNTTLALNGQQITVLASGFSSTQFEANINSVTGSNTEVGAASVFVTAAPYTALFGSGANVNSVQFQNLYISKAYIGVGNMGSGYILNGVICGCAIYAQGQNAQTAYVMNSGTLTNRNLLMGGVLLGGEWVSRAPGTGADSSDVLNDFNLLDGFNLTNSTFYFNLDSSSLPVQLEQYAGLNCWKDQYLTMLEGTGTRNSLQCWNPPGGVPRMTDQDITGLLFSDFMDRGIYGVGVAGMTMYGRPTNGVNISMFNIENNISYPIIIGPNNNDLIVDGVGPQGTGKCADGSYYGSPTCPDAFEPHNPMLQSVALTNFNGQPQQLVNITTDGNEAQAVSQPWQAVNNATDSTIANFGNTTLTSSGMSGANPYNALGGHTAFTQAVGGTLTQIDGSAIQTGSQAIKLVMSVFTNQFNGEWWAVQDRSDAYSQGNTLPVTLDFSVRGASGQVFAPSTVRLPGLRVSPNPPQGGNIATAVLGTAGTQYPLNHAVECAVAPSPVNTPGSTTSFYIPDCLGVALPSGAVSPLIHNARLGVGYTSAPSVVVAPPGAGTAHCTAPISGVPNATCTITNPGFGINSCITTPANFSGSGATYTPTCNASGYVTGLTITGGTGYPNFWEVFVGTNGGTQATMTTTVTPIDSQYQVQHFEICSFELNAGGSVPAKTTYTLTGITGNCGNLVNNAGNGRGDYLIILNNPGQIGYGGLNITAQTSAAGTLTMTLQNPTTASISYGAGIWTALAISANAGNTLTVPAAVTPTITTVINSATGVSTLSSGTITVSTTAACTPSVSCVYTLTNCNKNASTTIGTLAIGTISVGTSFVINSYTSAAAISTTDASTVCWQIN